MAYYEFVWLSHVFPPLELLRETYYKKNDVFILKMKTAADVFKGKTYSELQTWFFKYRQSAKNCGLTTMTEEEQYNFKLLTSMTEKMKTLLFVQNARPALQETPDFIDNQVIVEDMTKAPTKKADTVNNVIENTDKKIRCWDCNGEHKRTDCTANKKSLYCKRCRISGHSYEACRRRRRPTRSPSQSDWSTRSPSASSPTTSSAASEHDEKKKKKRKERGGKQRRSREEKKSKNDQRHKRASSQTTSASRSRSNSRSRGKAGRTPKTKRKIRDTVNIIQEDSFSDSESRMRATRMAELTQGEKTSSLKITVDTGSKYNIIDEAETSARGWKVEKLTEWEEPTLRYADGRKMPIVSKTCFWVRLDKEQNKRKVDLFVTPNLRSRLIIGLIDLKRLGWISPQWPLDIERWQSLFQNSPADDEDDEDVINNINDDDARGERGGDHGQG